MDKLLSNFTKVSVAMLMLTLPVCAWSYSSTFTNETQKYDPNGSGYTLELLATWGNGCVADAGKPILLPGESTVLKINRNCDWAGIKYKVLKHNTVIGYVAHSFRNEKFAVEVSLPCNDDNCAFTGLPPI